MNLTNILELTRGFVNKATNFTNKELFFNYLSLWFKSGALLLNPVNHSNDMVAFNFSQVRISALIITITICSNVIGASAALYFINHSVQL